MAAGGALGLRDAQQAQRPQAARPLHAPLTQALLPRGSSLLSPLKLALTQMPHSPRSAFKSASRRSIGWK